MKPFPESPPPVPPNEVPAEPAAPVATHESVAALPQPAPLSPADAAAAGASASHAAFHQTASYEWRQFIDPPSTRPGRTWLPDPRTLPRAVVV
jgi:hypothetical protein